MQPNEITAFAILAIVFGSLVVVAVVGAVEQVRDVLARPVVPACQPRLASPGTPPPPSPGSPATGPGR